MDKGAPRRAKKPSLARRLYLAAARVIAKPMTITVVGDETVTLTFPMAGPSAPVPLDPNADDSSRRKE